MTPHPRDSSDTQVCPNCTGCGSSKESSCDEPCGVWLEWHDAQVAAKVLDEVYGNLVLEWNRFDGDDPYEFFEVAKLLIESLRQREQP